MATTREFHDYIVENLQRAGQVSTRKMMGEYLVYYRDKLVGDICDNCLFLKPTKTALMLMPEAELDYPYHGSRTKMVVVEDTENTELMARVLQGMYEELPEPKKTGRARKEKAPSQKG